MQQWSVTGNRYELCDAAEKSLPPGVYTPRMGFFGPFLERREIVTDKLVSLDGNVSGDVMESVKKFAESREQYKQFGLLYKRGLLLHGAPGVGKTGTVWLVANELVKKHGAAVLLTEIATNSTAADALRMALHSIRSAHPEMLIVVVMEDVEKIKKMDSQGYNVTNKLLALMDGEDQVGNVVYLATTNFIEKLDSRLTNRPSRFDEVIRVLPPSSTGRWQYFRMFVDESQVSDDTLERWVAYTHGLNVAHLREFLVSVMVLGKDAKETGLRLLQMGNQTAEEVELKKGNWLSGKNVIEYAPVEMANE